MAYEAGTAFLQIVPSFSGVVDAITAEGTKWGVTAGKSFSKSFNDTVKEQTKNTPMGPSDTDTTKQGASTGGKFADAFKARVDAALKSLPDVKINADSSAADIKIAEIREALKTLASKRIGIDISDTDALAKLELIRGDLDELSLKSPSIRVKVDTAAAIAELEAVRLAADGASGAESGGGGSGGGLSGLASGAESASSSLGGPLLGSVVALLPVIVPLGAAVTGVAIGLAGMGTAALAGVGAFGIAALPIFSQVSGALSQISTDQDAVNRALTASAKSTALQHLSKDLSGLSPTVQAITLGVLGFKQAFKGWDAQFDPLILQVFNSALSDAAPFLKAITPLVYAGGDALKAFFDAMGGVLKSAAFQKFIEWLAANVGPAVGALTNLFIGIGGGFASLFENAQPFVDFVEKGLTDIGKGFAGLGASKDFKDFVKYLVTNGPAIGAFLSTFAQSVGELLLAMAPVGLKTLEILTPILKWINALVIAHPKIATAIIAMVAAAGAFAALLSIIGAAAAVIGAVTVPVLVIALAIAQIGIEIFLVVKYWRTAWTFIKQIAGDAWQFLDSNLVQPIENFFTKTIPNAFNSAVSFFAGLPAKILSALAALPGLLLTAAGDAIGGFALGLAYAIVGVWVFFADIVPKIAGFLVTLPGILLNAGVAAITAMASGIATAAVAIWNFFIGLPAKIGTFLKAAPGVMLGFGVSIVSGLANGISGAVGLVSSAVSDVVSAVTSLPGRIGNVGKAVADAITSAFTSAYDTVARAFNSTVGDGITVLGHHIGVPHLPVFHQGGLVPGSNGEDVLAVLQAGEMVIPRDQVSAGMDGTIRQIGDRANAPARAASGPAVGLINVTAYDPSEAARKTADAIGWVQKTRGW